MTDLEFDDQKYTSSSNVGAKNNLYNSSQSMSGQQTTGMIGFLIKHKLVKTEKQANILILICTILFFAISFVIFYLNS